MPKMPIGLDMVQIFHLQTRYTHAHVAIFARGEQSNFQSHLLAWPHEGARIFTPLLFVEINSKEVAMVVAQQWVYTDCLLAGQVIKNHLIGNR